jgi:hypothetical protein
MKNLVLILVLGLSVSIFTGCEENEVCTLYQDTSWLLGIFGNPEKEIETFGPSQFASDECQKEKKRKLEWDSNGKYWCECESE